MRTKLCSKCKIEKSVSEFNSDKNSKDGVGYWCKCCCNQYYKNNTEKIAKQKKQYYQDNREQKLEQKKQYRKDNVEKLAKQQEQYRKDNAERLAEQKKQYYKDNAERLAKYRKDGALFETYSKQLEMFEKERSCPENNKLLEVKCAYCGKWMQPTNSQVRNRLQVFNGTMPGEQRFYCSDNCKEACPIYNQSKYPKGFKQATSREVVPLLRQLVLERDNYTCQKCGATTETAQLHVHHEKSYTLNKIMANDPDNCVTLCKECHKKVHSNDGCKYSDLKCKRAV